MFLLDSFSIFIDHAQKSSQSLVLHFPLDTVFSVILQGETLQVQVFYSNMKDLSFTVNQISLRFITASANDAV